jgi:hypothetical protein
MLPFFCRHPSSARLLLSFANLVEAHDVARVACFVLRQRQHDAHENDGIAANVLLGLGLRLDTVRERRVPPRSPERDALRANAERPTEQVECARIVFREHDVESRE